MLTNWFSAQRNTEINTKWDPAEFSWEKGGVYLTSTEKMDGDGDGYLMQR